MVREGFPIYPAFLGGAGFDNLGNVTRARCPVLVVHGDKDVTIPTAMGRALAERLGARGELYVIPGADHNETYDVGGAAYVAKVRAFVARVTR